jgi:hypothetical protein
MRPSARAGGCRATARVEPGTLRALTFVVVYEVGQTRCRLDPIFDRAPDGAVDGVIRYDI